MTTHDLAHGIRALEREIAARTLSGAPGLVPLARAAGQMRRELAARGWNAMREVGKADAFRCRLVLS